MPLGRFISDRLTRVHGPQFGRKIVPIVGLSLGAVLTFLATAGAGLTAVVCLTLAFGLAAFC